MDHCSCSVINSGPYTQWPTHIGNRHQAFISKFFVFRQLFVHLIMCDILNYLVCVLCKKYLWWCFCLYSENESITLPYNWEPMAGEIVKRVIVVPGCDEYQRVVERLNAMTSVPRVCCYC